MKESPIIIVKPYIEMAIGVTVFLIFAFSVTQLWKSLSGIITFSVLILSYWIMGVIKEKKYKFYKERVEVITLLNQKSAFDYMQISHIVINNITYKDSGKRFIIYLEKKEISFAVRDKQIFFNLLELFRSKNINVTGRDRW